MKKLIEKAQNDCVVFVLLSAVLFLLGIIIGIFCSPAKNGMAIASNNTIISNEDDDDEEEDEDE